MRRRAPRRSLPAAGCGRGGVPPWTTAWTAAIPARSSGSARTRPPTAGGKIPTSMMLTLVFIETAIIYALLVAILIIFVL